jgi:hypothetical protein
MDSCFLDTRRGLTTVADGIGCAGCLNCGGHNYGVSLCRRMFRGHNRVPSTDDKRRNTAFPRVKTEKPSLSTRDIRLFTVRLPRQGMLQKTLLPRSRVIALLRRRSRDRPGKYAVTFSLAGRSSITRRRNPRTEAKVQARLCTH